MAVKKPEYKTQREAEDFIDFDPQPTIQRPSEIEQPKNSNQMKMRLTKSILMKGIVMKAVSIHPVKMESMNLKSVVVL